VHRPEWSATCLAQLLAEAGSDNVGWSAGPVIRILHADGDDWDMTDSDRDDSGEAGAGQPPPLGAVLGDLIARRATQPQQRTRWLAAAHAAVDKHLQAIVGGQQRAFYDRAARLAVACGEALSIADPGGSADFAAAVRARYPRHVAFRRELDAVRAASPVA
jgi:hypothetical protein